MTSTQFPGRISDNEMRATNDRLMTSSSEGETLQEKKIRLAISSFFPPDMSGDRASEYLKFLHSISRTASTLTKLRWKGGGPVFRKIGKAQVLYSQQDLDDWAAKVLSKPLQRTADFKSKAANS